MSRLIPLLLFVTLAFACGKDKLATKPTIKITSESASFIPNNGVLQIEMEFTDKEGDISNTLFVQKIRTNKRTVPTIRDTFSLTVPDYPKNTQGVLQTTLYYQAHLLSAINPPNLGGNPPRFEDDSLIIRFVLRDLAGNVSDTVSTKPIVVSRN